MKTVTTSTGKTVSYFDKDKEIEILKQKYPDIFNNAKTVKWINNDNIGFYYELPNGVKKYAVYQVNHEDHTLTPLVVRVQSEKLVPKGTPIDVEDEQTKTLDEVLRKTFPNNPLLGPAEQNPKATIPTHAKGVEEIKPLTYTNTYVPEDTRFQQTDSTVENTTHTIEDVNSIKLKQTLATKEDKKAEKKSIQVTSTPKTPKSESSVSKEIGKIPDTYLWPPSAFGISLPSFEEYVYVCKVSEPHIIVFDNNNFVKFRKKSIQPALGVSKYTIYAVAQQLSISENTQYGQTFLERLNNLFAPTVSQLMQLYGMRSGQEAVEKGLQTAGEAYNALKEHLPALNVLEGAVKKGYELLKKIVPQEAQKQGSQASQKVWNLLKTLATGGKIILPKVWQNTNMSFNMQLKVLLVASKEDEWESNIGEALKHLIGLSMPVLDKNQSGALILIYPPLWNVELVGLRRLKNAYVSDITATTLPEFGFTSDGKPMGVEVTLTWTDISDVAVDTDSPVFTTLDEVLGLS